MNGKGSKPRPIKNIKKYISNWEQINWSKTPKKRYIETPKGRRVYLDDDDKAREG